MAAHHFVLLFICPIIGILCEDLNKYSVEDDLIWTHSPNSETILSNYDGHVAKTLTWLVNHVEQLERKLEAQEKVNRKLQKKIRCLEDSVQTRREHEQSTKKLEHRLSVLENILSKHYNSDYTETPTRSLHEKEEGFSNVTDKNNRTGRNEVFKKLPSQKRLLVATPIPTTPRTPTGNLVAFSAYLSASESHPGQHQTVIFDSVVTNVGNHYNQYSGMFTVPESGNYVFSWHIISVANGHIFCDIVVNSSIKGATEADARGSQAISSATGLVVVQVNKNDIVFIRTNPADSIVGAIVSYYDVRSTFSGWLLG